MEQSQEGFQDIKQTLSIGIIVLTILVNTLRVLNIKVTKDMDPERLHFLSSLTKLMILNTLLDNLNSLGILIQEPLISLIVIQLNIVQIDSDKSFG